MRIYINLTWNDTHSWPPEQITRMYVPYVPQPDTFHLSVKQQDGSEVTFFPSNKLKNTSINGSIGIKALLNERPTRKTVFAKSPQEAFNQTDVSKRHEIWEINITCIDAPGTGPGGFAGPGYDMGNDWELSITIFSYVTSVTEIRR